MLIKIKIAIIGSGIAGLTLANFLLKNSKFDFKVYEKNDGLSIDKGYGIQLSPNSISILKELDFENINKKKVFHPQKINFLGFNQKYIGELDLSKFNYKDVKYTTLGRNTLYEFLKEKIFKSNLKFKKEVKKVTELKNKLLINFEDNTNDLVDYMFVCDGVFSNTKSLIENKNLSPTYSGAVAIRTILNSKNHKELDAKNISILMGSNAHIVSYPINHQGDLNLVTIIRSKSDKTSKDDLLEKNVFNQNKKLKNFYNHDCSVWPIYTSSKILKSHNKKVFYLGDAFHAFLPTMAQGASQSIEDAFELSKLLEKNIKDFHSTYYEKRLKKIKMVSLRSKINYFSFHISNSVLTKIRNFVIKYLVKKKKFLNNYLGKVYY